MLPSPARWLLTSCSLSRIGTCRFREGESCAPSPPIGRDGEGTWPRESVPTVCVPSHFVKEEYATIGFHLFLLKSETRPFSRGDGIYGYGGCCLLRPGRCVGGRPEADCSRPTPKPLQPRGASRNESVRASSEPDEEQSQKSKRNDRHATSEPGAPATSLETDHGRRFASIRHPF